MLDDSVSFKPGTLSEDDVLLIAHELGPLWKKVGLVLKVPKAVIDQIEANRSEVSDKCYRYILLDVLLYSIAEYFYELCRILTSP